MDPIEYAMLRGLVWREGAQRSRPGIPPGGPLVARVTGLPHVVLLPFAQDIYAGSGFELSKFVSEGPDDAGKADQAMLLELGLERPYLGTIAVPLVGHDLTKSKCAGRRAT